MLLSSTPTLRSSASAALTALFLTLPLSLFPTRLEARYEIRFPAAALSARAIFNPLLPLNVSALTLSLEIRMEVRTGNPFLVSYAVRDHPNEFALWLPGNDNPHFGVVLGGVKFQVMKKTMFPTGEEIGGDWMPIAVIWDGMKSDLRLVVNGNEFFPEAQSEKPVKKRLLAGGKLVFGQKLNTFAESKFASNQRFIGSVRRVNLWGRAFTLAELKAFYKAQADGIRYPRPADIINFPLLRLEDGAVSEWVQYQRVARCNESDKLFGFKGLREMPPIYHFSERKCKEACENLTWAKGWTLTSRSHVTGFCYCYKTITGYTINADHYSGLICGCKKQHLRSIIATTPEIESLDSGSLNKRDNFDDHELVFAKCAPGFVPLRGDRVIFECLPMTLWDSGPNWKQWSETRCVRKQF